MNSLSRYDLFILKGFNLNFHSKVVWKIKLVVWKKPPIGWVKFNCDGSCSGYPKNLGGGGLIRDEMGRVKGAFSIHFGMETNNGAKMRAILEGVQMCKRLGYTNIIIESDSKLVVVWLLVGKCLLQYLWDFWEELLIEIDGIDFMVIHQNRKGESSSRFSCKVRRKQGLNNCYTGHSNLSTYLKGIVWIDRLGIPNFRKLFFGV